MRPRTVAFFLAIALLAASAFRHAATAPIWNPRDEIAHFDFIDQLADLQYPTPSDPITDHTAHLCRDEFEWYKPAQYDGGKASMGLAGWSYESQNPPFYYGLLAPLHRMVKAFGAGGTTQVITLRLAGVILFMVGALVLLPIFAELERSFSVPRVYGTWLALVALTTNHHYLTSLGNDVLSMPLSCAAFYFALRYWRTASPGALFGLVVAAGIASVTKLTNVPLLLLPLLSVIAIYARSRGREVASYTWAIPPLALLPLLLYFSLNVVVSGSLLGCGEAREIFATFVEPERPPQAFLGTMVADSFNLQSFGIGFRWELKVSLAALLFFGALQSLVWLARGKRRQEAALHLVAVATVLITLTVGLALSEVIRGVHWQAFRHYYAVLPLWLFAFLAPALRLLDRITRRWGSEVL